MIGVFLLVFLVFFKVILAVIEIQNWPQQADYMFIFSLFYTMFVLHVCVCVKFEIYGFFFYFLGWMLYFFNFFKLYFFVYVIDLEIKLVFCMHIYRLHEIYVCVCVLFKSIFPFLDFYIYIRFNSNNK